VTVLFLTRQQVQNCDIFHTAPVTDDSVGISTR